MDDMAIRDFYESAGFYELDGEQVEVDNIINLTGKNIVLLMKGRRYTYLPRLEKLDTEEIEPRVVLDDDYSIHEMPFVAKYPIPEEKEGIMILVKEKTALTLMGRRDVFVPIMTSLSDLESGFKIAKGLYRIT